MLSDKTLRHADLYFRAFLHVVVPLHRSLVEEMCKSGSPPLELPTRLEDIGLEYTGMAGDLAGTLIDNNRMADEPDPDDYTEARIEQFVGDLFARSGTLLLHDGTEIDGKTALERIPVVADAIKTALWIAKSSAAGSRG